MERIPDRTTLIRCEGDGVRIAHWTPGRVRFVLRDPSEAVGFAKSIQRIPGVTSARANTVSGSVVVQYLDGSEEMESLLSSRSLSHNGLVGAAAGRPRNVCSACQQPLRNTDKAEAVSKLVRLTGSVVTGDVVGIVLWLLSHSLESSDELGSYPVAA